MICGRFASHSDYTIQSASEPNVTCSASCSIAQGNEYAVQMGFLIQLTLKGKRTPCLCGRCLHLMNFYYFNDLLRPHDRGQTTLYCGRRRCWLGPPHVVYRTYVCEHWIDQSTWKWRKFMKNDLVLCTSFIVHVVPIPRHEKSNR